MGYPPSHEMSPAVSVRRKAAGSAPKTFTLSDEDCFGICSLNPPLFAAGSLLFDWPMVESSFEEVDIPRLPPARCARPDNK